MLPAAQVFLCVQRPELRRLLRALLAAYGEVETVGDADASEPAVRAVAVRQPDVVLVWSRDPGIATAKLVGRVRAVAPLTGVVAVAQADQRPRTLIARRLEADRYVDPALGPGGAASAIVDLARERAEASSRGALSVH
jgi:DNA-binding NarL/FixJ family response regulator